VDIQNRRQWCRSEAEKTGKGRKGRKGAIVRENVHHSGVSISWPVPEKEGARRGGQRQRDRGAGGEGAASEFTE
jgi:hypothetical protein